MKKTSTNSYIKKHQKFIDYRINLISDYLLEKDQNQQNDIISELITGLISPEPMFLSVLELHPSISTTLGDLREAAEKYDIISDGDIIGYIYQSIRSRSEKKKSGQFFTPGDIVSYMIDLSFAKIENITKARIFDPACGSGQFLIEAYKKLLISYKAQGIHEELAKHLIIKRNLFANDTDPLAAKIAEYNIRKISNLKDVKTNIQSLNYLYRDDFEFSDGYKTDGKYDLIIGNPPWGSTLSPVEKKYFRKSYRSAVSGINTFTLFIERSCLLLKPNGYISFLTPEAYLNIKAHKASRQMILENNSIINIAMWGERFKGVFAPSISFLFRNESDEDRRKRNIVKVTHPGANSSETILIPQDNYHRTYESIFNIKYSKKAVSLIETIHSQDCFYLKDRSRFFLGIVTGNNSKHISEIRTDEFPDPIITGQDLSQYRIDFSDHYFKFNPDDLQQSAPDELYRSNNKILYKFIGKNLTFATDKQGIHSLNNVNGFIPEFDINPDTLTCILNSRLMQYYYENNFFTVKVLRGNLERLPIKNIREKTGQKLAILGRNLSELPGESLHASRTRETIEDIIFHEYGFKDRDAFRLTEMVKSA